MIEGFGFPLSVTVIGGALLLWVLALATNEVCTCGQCVNWSIFTEWYRHCVLHLLLQTN